MTMKCFLDSVLLMTASDAMTDYKTSMAGVHIVLWLTIGTIFWSEAKSKIPLNRQTTEQTMATAPPIVLLTIPHLESTLY